MYYPINPINRRTFLAQTSVLGSVLGLAACGGGGGGDAASDPVDPVTPIELKVLVPAYRYDGAVWKALAATKTPLVVIANVSNGPGKRLDVQYQSWIEGVRNAGHRVKGYVYTSYGKRNTATVLADIEAWNTFYGIDDFFLDEATATTTYLSYYGNLLNQAVANVPTRRFMLNPGMPPDKGYFGLLPGVEMLVYENPWYKYTTSSLPTWLNTYASQCWILALEADESEMQAVAAVTRARNFAGFFATDSAFTAGLPSYWVNEATLATTL